MITIPKELTNKDKYEECKSKKENGCSERKKERNEWILTTRVVPLASRSDALTSPDTMQFDEWSQCTLLW